MSNRRMFSNRIANSARFLQMPSESQLLYFHLCLRADDDGVVEAYPLMKLLGTQPDAFKVLFAREFIRQLNEDQVVVVTDWLEHNVIRADRKVDSIYKHLLPKNIKTIEVKPRSDVEDNSKRLGGQSTDGISKVKLSKVKLIKIASQSSAAPIKSKKGGEPEDSNESMTLEEFLISCRSSPRRYVRLVGEFADEKKLAFDSKGQWRVFLSRNLRPAKNLEPFTDQQIGKAMKDIKSSEYITKWTLETLFKYLTK